MTTPTPGDPQPLSYQSGSPYGNAPTLVRLAIIFNYISAAFDGMLCLLASGCGALILAASGADGFRNAPSAWFGAGIFLAMGLITIASAVLKVIGTRKLRLRAQSARGWGLAIGIIGAAQVVLTSPLAVIQIAAGIFTIVVMCMGKVRSYLKSPDESNATPTQGA